MCGIMVLNQTILISFNYMFLWHKEDSLTSFLVSSRIQKWTIICIVQWYPRKHIQLESDGNTC